MFFELRQYRTKPGQREKWVKFMEEEIIPFQVSKGMVILGSFVGQEEDDLYVWIRRFESFLGEYEKFIFSQPCQGIEHGRHIYLCLEPWPPSHYFPRADDRSSLFEAFGCAWSDLVESCLGSWSPALQVSAILLAFLPQPPAHAAYRSSQAVKNEQENGGS